MLDINKLVTNLNLLAAFQIVNKHGEYPPIMKTSSWTKAAPYKETPFHRTPSESIANNFTPTAQELKIRTLNKLKGNGKRVGKEESNQHGAKHRKITPDRNNNTNGLLLNKRQKLGSIK